MTIDAEIAALRGLAHVRPVQIRKKAEMLRRRSRQCADLAADCVTDEAKLVLSGLAEELGGEADELEDTLLQIRKLYVETFDNELGANIES